MGIVCGVGYYSKGKYSSRDGDKKSREYNRWCDMIKRCYRTNKSERLRSYEGCTVSDRFLNFQLFCLWGEKQVGFFDEGYHLDKDLLSYGNRVYSPTTCVLLPTEVNHFLSIYRKESDHSLIGGKYYKKNDNYVAQINGGSGGKRIHLGYYETREAAASAYRDAKEEMAKALAEKFRGKISEVAYNALCNFKVVRDCQ